MTSDALFWTGVRTAKIVTAPGQCPVNNRNARKYRKCGRQLCWTPYLDETAPRNRALRLTSWMNWPMAELDRSALPTYSVHSRIHRTTIKLRQTVDCSEIAALHGNKWKRPTCDQIHTENSNIINSRKANKATHHFLTYLVAPRSPTLHSDVAFFRYYPFGLFCCQ